MSEAKWLHPARLAIGIVTHDSLRDLDAFLEAQLHAADACGALVVLVDNGSRDGTLELLREHERNEQRLTLVANRGNRGYAAAVNQVFSAAGNRDVMLLNPDVEVKGDGSIAELVEFLDHHPRAGVVGPRLLEPDGLTQPSARPFPSPLAMAGHSSVARRLPSARRAAMRYLALQERGEPVRVDWVLGAAMVIRRSAYDEVGGWDERFFLYLEDTDFCLRLAQRGWETWYLPTVSFRHLHARESDPSKGAFITSPARRAHVRSMLRFFARNPRLIAGRHLHGPQ